MKNPNLIEVYENKSIIHASPVVVSPGSRPKRLVLRELVDEFVVHVEYLRVDTREEWRDGKRYDVVTFSNDCFEHGHYFSARGRTREAALAEATKDFWARVRDLERGTGHQ